LDHSNPDFAGSLGDCRRDGSRTERGATYRRYGVIPDQWRRYADHVRGFRRFGTAAVSTFLIAAIGLPLCSGAGASPTIRQVPNPNFRFPDAIAKYMRFPATVAYDGVFVCGKGGSKADCHPFRAHRGMVATTLFVKATDSSQLQTALFRSLESQGWTVNPKKVGQSNYRVAGHGWQGELLVTPLVSGSSSPVEADDHLALWPDS